MIRKFATVSGFRVALASILATILTGTAVAQQTGPQQAPAQQPAAQPQPQNPPSGGQEPAPEEEIPVRKPKPREYTNWTFNVGGGASLTHGTTQKFVRGGGAVGAAGVARNFSKYFAVRLDFQFDNLPLRSSALQLAQAPGGTSQVYSLMLDAIINVPVTREWGGYFVFGPGFYRRTGKLDSSTAIPGSACNPFFAWWGTCRAASLPLSGDFLKANQNQFGENFGAGITRKIRPNVDIYAEFRYLHGTNSPVTTDLTPITVGVRW